MPREIRHELKNPAQSPVSILELIRADHEFDFFFPDTFLGAVDVGY